MKTNRELARLVIKDLAKITGFTFAGKNTLTRAEAAQVRAWAMNDPTVQKAFKMGAGNPEFEAVQLFGGVVTHFAHHHPQVGDQPEAWPARPPLQATKENPFADLYPDEASARLKWAETTPDYVAALMDGKHPDHGDMREQTAWLHQIAAMASPAESADAGDAPIGGQAAFDAKVAELRANPAYMDGTHLGHAAAVQAVTALYEAHYSTAPRGRDGNPAAAATPPAAVIKPGEPIGGAAAFNARLAELQANPAYMNGQHMGHKAAVAAVSAHYQAGYPADAPRAQDGSARVHEASAEPPPAAE